MISLKACSGIDKLPNKVMQMHNAAYASDASVIKPQIYEFYSGKKI